MVAKRQTSCKIISVVLLVCISSYSYAQQKSEAKYENILAVFIYNITKFIQLPDNNAENINLSVLGKNTIIAPLSSIARTEKVNGKTMLVGELNDLNTLGNTTILFFPSDDENKLTAVLKRIRGKKILLITNAKGFAEKGAGINFIREEDKIKFEINRKVLEENGFIPNSRLLSIAAKVYE